MIDKFDVRMNEKISLGFKCVQPCQVRLLTGELVTVEAFHYLDTLVTDEEAKRRLYNLKREGDTNLVPNEVELIDLIGEDAFIALP
jgi:hypothetical protein